MLIDLMREEGTFDPPTPFDHTVSLTRGVIGLGVKMGEGWLLTAEMLELYEKGVHNIVCTQPFGCLPNHICGKGMMKPIKDRHPDINIVAIDYDAGATRVNQVNRLKLMLANARMNEREAAGPREAAENGKTVPLRRLTKGADHCAGERRRFVCGQSSLPRQWKSSSLSFKSCKALKISCILASVRVMTSAQLRSSSTMKAGTSSEDL